MDALEAIGEALAAEGYATSAVRVDGRPALAARRSEFRWRWLATRLDTVVVVARFDDPGPGREELDRFAGLAARYAAAGNRGRPAGLQKGTVIVAVAVVDRAGEAAAAWARRRRAHRFARIDYPIVAETTTGNVLRPRRVVAGAVYASHLRAIAEEIVGPAVRRARAS